MIKDEIVFEQFAQSYRASIKTTTQTTQDLLRINAWQILKQKVDPYHTEASMTCIKNRVRYIQVKARTLMCFTNGLTSQHHIYVHSQPGLQMK